MSQQDIFEFNLDDNHFFFSDLSDSDTDTKTTTHMSHTYVDNQFNKQQYIYDIFETYTIDLDNVQKTYIEANVDKVYDLWILNKVSQKYQDSDQCPELYWNLTGLKYQVVDKDYNQAKMYYLLAINNKCHTQQHCSYAMNNYGKLVEKIDKDYKLAKKYYHMSSTLGNVMAMTNHGLLSQTIDKDYLMAKTYYLRAIYKGCSEAMYQYALMLEEVYKKHEASNIYFEMAIKHGHVKAMYEYGYILETVYLDFKKARQMYIKANSLGSAFAAFRLGYLSQFHDKNLQMAKSYYDYCYIRQYADYDGRLMYYYGLILEQLDKDYDNACACYLKAIQKNHLYATIRYANLLKDHYNNNNEACKYFKIYENLKNKMYKN